MPIWRRKFSPMARAFLRVIPLIWVSRSGCSSSTVRVSSPNSSTMRLAVAAPMTFTAPEER